MTYGYVYVAQIAMGANPNQTLQAIREAEAYEGPSLIIAYAPCINHGIRSGMDKAMLEMKRAVRSGYWNLFRYNPQLEEDGQNPLSLDSGKPTESFQEFLMGEVRYRSLKLREPQRAEDLFKKAERDALRRYENLRSRKESFEVGKEGKSR